MLINVLLPPLNFKASQLDWVKMNHKRSSSPVPLIFRFIIIGDAFKIHVTHTKNWKNGWDRKIFEKNLKGRTTLEVGVALLPHT